MYRYNHLIGFYRLTILMLAHRNVIHILISSSLLLDNNMKIRHNLTGRTSTPNPNGCTGTLLYDNYGHFGDINK